MFADRTLCVAPSVYGGSSSPVKSKHPEPLTATIGALLRVTIRGKRWNLIFVPELPNNDRGDCQGPHIRNKKIRIREGMREKTTLEILLHEILHAANWDLDEQAIQETAEAQADILWSLGYRRELDD